MEERRGPFKKILWLMGAWGSLMLEAKAMIEARAGRAKDPSKKEDAPHCPFKVQAQGGGSPALLCFDPGMTDVTAPQQKMFDDLSRAASWQACMHIKERYQIHDGVSAGDVVVYL